MWSPSSLNSCATPVQTVYDPNEPNNEKEPNHLPQLCRRHTAVLSPNDYSPIDSLCQCIDEVNSWMCQNFLQLNRDKIEVIAFGSKDEVPKKTMRQLQLIQIAAARILSRTRKHEHTPVLRSLHWLPVTFRIDFKVLLVVYKSLNGLGPQYIADIHWIWTDHLDH